MPPRVDSGSMFCRPALPTVLAISSIISFGSLCFACEPATTRYKTGSPAQVSAAKAKRLAVIVGVDKIADERLSTDLPLAKSAMDFKGALEAVGFKRENICTLVGEDATSDSIKQTLEGGWLPEHATRHDLVLVYLSAPFFPSAKDGELVFAYDTDLSRLRRTALDVKKLLLRLARKTRCKQLVIVLQTPFSGGPEKFADFNSRFGTYNVDIDKRWFSRLPGNVVIASASSSRQLAWTVKFSDSLIASLKEYPQASFHRIFKASKEKTVAETTGKCAGCKVQTPVIFGDAGSVHLDFPGGKQAEISTPDRRADGPAVIN